MISHLVSPILKSHIFAESLTPWTAHSNMKAYIENFGILIVLVLALKDTEREVLMLIQSIKLEHISFTCTRIQTSKRSFSIGLYFKLRYTTVRWEERYLSLRSLQVNFVMCHLFLSLTRNSIGLEIPCRKEMLFSHWDLSLKVTCLEISCCMIFLRFDL